MTTMAILLTKQKIEADVFPHPFTSCEIWPERVAGCRGTPHEEKSLTPGL